MAVSALGWVQDERSEPRDAVHHRTRAGFPDGRLLPFLVVNSSASGLMARCEGPCEPGERLRVDLPVVGAMPVEVRWALGGRIGCRFVQPLGLAEYYALLAAMRI